MYLDSTQSDPQYKEVTALWKNCPFRRLQKIDWLRIIGKIWSTCFASPHKLHKKKSIEFLYCDTYSVFKLGLIADPVIKLLWGWNLRMAWGRESSLEAAGTLVAAAPSPGSILHHPGGAGWSWGRCGCEKGPLSDRIPILPSSAHGWY